MADDHAGQAGEGVTGDVVLALLGDTAAVQAHLVPEGRQLRGEVRIVGEQRLAGGGVLAGDDPGVGADAVAVGAEQRGDGVEHVGEAGELALHTGVGTGTGVYPLSGPGAGARVGADTRARAGARTVGAGSSGSGSFTASLTGPGVLGGGRGRVVLAGGRVDGALVDDGLVPVDRVVRVEVGDLGRAEAAGQQGAVDLVLHVAAQVPGHGLEPGDRVDGRPRFGLVVVGEAECRVLDGALLGALRREVGVDAVGVGAQVRLGALGELGVVLLLGHPVPAEGAQEGVGVDLALAEHLGEAARGGVPADVHLPEAVLRLDVTLGAEEVLVAVGVEMGNAVAVPADLHRGAETVEFEASLGLREGRTDRADAPVRAVSDTRDEREDQDEDGSAGSATLSPAGRMAG